jgi:signal-transduction protein with cAMP-binding, CBS, and nucleotidyltransferase domain
LVNREKSMEASYLPLGLVAATVAVGLLWLLVRVRSLAAGPFAQEESIANSISPDHLFVKRQRLLHLFMEERVVSGGGAEVLVGELMSTLLVTVRSEARRKEIRQTMTECVVRHVLVVDDERRLLGIVSDRDLKQRAGATAGEIMTRRPLAITPNTPLLPAITTMLQRSISCLPVVDGDALVGVLTTTDLLLSLQCVLQSLQRAKSAAADPDADAEADELPEAELVGCADE